MTLTALRTTAGPVEPASLFKDIIAGKTGVGAGYEPAPVLSGTEGFLYMLEMIEDVPFSNMQLGREFKRRPAPLLEEFDNLLA